VHLANSALNVYGLLATGAVLLALTMAGFALLRLRATAAEARAAQADIDALSDKIWELREAEERARGMLEAQGDLIVRRDSTGRITYANDAFCTLAGKTRTALIGSMSVLPAIERGRVSTHP